jgi:hypothetical protein
MSMKDRIKIRCPECGQPNETEVWYSVNANLDIEARERLLSGDLNSFQCSGCGYRGRVDAELLYYDGENGIAAYYLPFDRVEDDRFISRWRRDGFIDIDTDSVSFELLCSLNNVHTVFDIDEMVRYIHFRERLIRSSSIAEGRKI